jgi:DNA polymerase
MTGLALPAARGRLLPIEIGGARVNAVATYHPRYLLQRPAAKAGAWADLQRLVEGF